jgi:hypothetical protein
LWKMIKVKEIEVKPLFPLHISLNSCYHLKAILIGSGYIEAFIFAFIGPEVAICALLGAILFLFIYDGIDLNYFMKNVKDSQMK